MASLIVYDRLTYINLGVLWHNCDHALCQYYHVVHFDNTLSVPHENEEVIAVILCTHLRKEEKFCNKKSVCVKSLRHYYKRTLIRFVLN